MGQQAIASPQTGLKKEKIKPVSPRFDPVLLISVFALLLIGILFVYSSSWNYVLRSGSSASFILKRQLGFIAVGLIAAFIVSLINYHFYKKWVVLFMIATLGMLVAVFLVGTQMVGVPSRGLFNNSVQPSELAKLAIILYLSVWLNSHREYLSSFTLGIMPLLAIVGVTGGLIFMQPDISAAITVVALGGLMFFLAGSDIKHVILALAFVLTVGTLFVLVNSTGQHRISSYLEGLASLQNASDHVRRSLEAIVRGGVFGVGIGQSTSKYLGLPVPWTDSIFAVIVEETGLLGGLIVLGLFITIAWRGIRIARSAPDLLGKLIAGGVSVWITLEALINIGVMVNIFPFAGNALPLVSYGGSSMVVTLVGIGLLMNVAKNSGPQAAKVDSKGYHAAVDLRRRNGGRGVSRSDGSANTRK